MPRRTLQYWEVLRSNAHCSGRSSNHDLLPRRSVPRSRPRSHPPLCLPVPPPPSKENNLQHFTHSYIHHSTRIARPSSLSHLLIFMLSILHIFPNLSSLFLSPRLSSGSPLERLKHHPNLYNKTKKSFKKVFFYFIYPTFGGKIDAARGLVFAKGVLHLWTTTSSRILAGTEITWRMARQEQIGEA